MWESPGRFRPKLGPCLIKQDIISLTDTHSYAHTSPYRQSFQLFDHISTSPASFIPLTCKMSPDFFFFLFHSLPCNCSLPHIHLIHISRAPCLSQHLGLIYIGCEIHKPARRPTHCVCVCVCVCGHPSSCFLVCAAFVP